MTFQLLAVDDNQLNLGLFRLFLTQLGHQVTAISDPFEALEQTQTTNFDLILTDIQMPGLSGIELSEKIRAQGFEGPIIAITAHLSDLEESEIENSQVDAILIKPVTKTDLARLIDDWLLNPQPANKPTKPSAPQAVKETAGPSETYDLDLALARANDSQGLVVEMLALLADSLQSSIQTLNQDPDDEALRQCLHQMMGGVRFSGAAKLEAELERARHLVNDKRFSDADKAQLMSEIQAVIDWQKEQPNPFKR